MSWLDVSTYIYLHSGSLAATTGLASVVILVLMSTLTVGEYEDHGFKKLKSGFILIGLIWFAVSFFALMPTHQKILAVKIARIKNEAVSKENVTKGVETLERIGKKLECKYLGCDGDEKGEGL